MNEIRVSGGLAESTASATTVVLPVKILTWNHYCVNCRATMPFIDGGTYYFCDACSKRLVKVMRVTT